MNRFWRFFVYSFLFVSFVAGEAHPATVVVLKGADTPFYRRIFSGFSSAATEKVTAFHYDETKDAALLNQVKKLSPDLIFSIGPIPLKRTVDALPATPIVACQPLSDSVSMTNVLRIDHEQPIKSSLALIQALFPTRKTVGTVYNPKLSQATFNALVAEGAKAGLRIASLKVDVPADVKTLINALSGKIDVFLWIRDGTTANESVVTAIYEFAERNSIPVVTPEPDHLDKGALLAVSYDPFRLGEQAWETAKSILKEKKIGAVAPDASGSAAVVTISLKAASRFGIGSDLLYTFFQKTLKQNLSVQIVP